MPDFYTIYLIVLLFGLSNCVIWGAIVYRYRDLDAARYWLAGSIAGVFGGLTLSLQGSSGLPLETIAGNTIVTLGFWLNYMGLRRFHGDKPKPLWTGLLLALSTAAMLATFHPWYGRNPVYTLAQALPLLATALYLLRSGRELGAVITSAAMGIACVSHWAIAGGNILLLIEIIPDRNLSDFAALDLLVFLFAAVTWNFGFLISVIGHLRYEVGRLAHEDDLTGLANRRMFMRHLDAACGPQNQERKFSVMLFDLDRFKTINDTYGHGAGDAALNHAVDIFRRHLRQEDLFARLGGDEFCVLLLGLDEHETSAITERALGALRTSPFRWQDVCLNVTASIGIASSKTGSLSRSDIILEEADRALYDTKRRGRDGLTVSIPSDERNASANVIGFEPVSIKSRHLSR